MCGKWGKNMQLIPGHIWARDVVGHGAWIKPSDDHCAPLSATWCYHFQTYKVDLFILCLEET